jgi:hypothetical protein
MSAAVFRALIYADSRVLWRDPLLGTSVVKLQDSRAPTAP